MMDDDDLHSNGKNKPPPRRRRCYCCSGTTAATLLMFLLTNAVSVAVVSSGAGPSLLRRYRSSGYRPAATIVHLWDGSAALQADLNATQAALTTGRAYLADLHARVRTANELIQTLLQAMQDHGGRDLPTTPDCGWKREPTGELRLAVGLHRKVAGAMAGQVFSAYAQRLRAVATPSVPPTVAQGVPRAIAAARSLWTTPPDTTVVWNAYACKNYSCLAATACGSDISGCDDGCFDPRRGWGNKNKANRWARDDGALSYSIDAVLRARPNGTVQIGLDLCGGSPSGTFAARMLERARVTVLTVVVNSDTPFGSFVALRGLVPLHVTAAHRLPLFDGTMDIVHAGHDLGVSGWMATDVMLEFALFDMYRVLRPGGLFWLDHFICAATQLNATFAPMLDRVGFRKLRWNTGRGKEKGQWYVSALLEKPMT
ncbi:unnamed protein product [Miscanthus lutarioriparius]|uniref:Methyltransferase type 11 domain-containing protein n=1 Tax=Miscanthus lutarioriparius TaxID=422564 RepID=A0A811R8D9_9POAL|nr:unnamed protein product [Miscanthus lutarioriparius]